MFTSNNNKIPVFAEDNEARWFVKKLVPQHLDKIYFLDATFPCTELVRLRKADANFFTKAILIVDGDVKKDDVTTANAVTPDSGRNVSNLITLPGSVRPEGCIYNYLTEEMTADHPYYNANPSTSKMVIEENGPLHGEKYAPIKKERDKYKKWFNDHLDLFENTNLMDYWIEDHKDDCDRFKQDFTKALAAAKLEMNMTSI